MPREEDAIQQAVLEHWRVFGTPGSLVAAIPNKRAWGQAGLTPGLFDLIVLSETLGDRTGWLELKTVKGRLSDVQRDIRGILIKRGVPHAVAYGRDEPIRVLEAWGAVRSTAQQRREAAHGAVESRVSHPQGVPAGDQTRSEGDTAFPPGAVA